VKISYPNYKNIKKGDPRYMLISYRFFFLCSIPDKILKSIDPKTDIHLNYY